MEEEEEFTDVDFAEALMLLGGITFIMMLFYLVNDPDQDMRYYSWSVISATLSIFAAVLIFSGINHLLHEYVLPHSEAWDQRFFGMIWVWVRTGRPGFSSPNMNRIDSTRRSMGSRF